MLSNHLLFFLVQGMTEYNHVPIVDKYRPEFMEILISFKDHR